MTINLHCASIFIEVRIVRYPLFLESLGNCCPNDAIFVF